VSKKYILKTANSYQKEVSMLPVMGRHRRFSKNSF
jgi:hypothetical protein